MTAVELALAKQRLQLASAAHRDALARHSQGLIPIFDAADQARAGVRWARQNPEIVAGGVALIAATRPGARRFFWRWGRRAFVAWRLWRDSERWLNAPETAR